MRKSKLLVTPFRQLYFGSVRQIDDVNLADAYVGEALHLDTFKCQPRLICNGRINSELSIAGYRLLVPHCPFYPICCMYIYEVEKICQKKNNLIIISRVMFWINERGLYMEIIEKTAYTVIHLHIGSNFYLQYLWEHITTTSCIVLFIFYRLSTLCVL